MRRTLSLLTILSSAMFLAGCGDSSSSNSYPAALNGQYFLHAQVYDYISGVSAVKDAAKLPAAVTAKAPHKGAFIDLEKKNQAAKPQLSAKPQSGSLNSSFLHAQLAGSLTFDGNGNITGGEIDFNEPQYGGVTSVSVNGTYAIDSAGQGVMDFGNGNFGFELYFTVKGGVITTSADEAPFVEFASDAFGDYIEIGSGDMLKQDPSSFTQGSLNGAYAFGWTGETCYGCTQAQSGDISAAGALTFNGSGGITGSADIATGFATDNGVGITGTVIAPDANGRATASLSTTGYNNGALPQNYAIYMIDASHFWVVALDQSSTTLAAAIVSGEGVQQSGTFGSGTLSGNYLWYESKEDLANEQPNNADTYADSTIALLSASGATLSGTADSNQAGTAASNVPVSFGYTVATNGRVVLTGTQGNGAAPPVCWFASSAQGFCTEQPDAAALTEAGLINVMQQSGSGFSNSSINGTYSVGTTPGATALTVFTEGGTIADGNGNLANQDSNGSLSVVGAIYNQIAFTADSTGTYTLSSSGRGTLSPTGNSGFGIGVIYAFNNSTFLQLDTTNVPSPAIYLFQQ